VWHIFLVCVTVLGKNRTPLGFVRLLRIHRHSALTPLVRCRLLGVPPQLSPITTNNLPWDRRWNSRCVDGTKNFVHGFPFVCISLGLIDRRVPVLGVIYNPFLEQLYTGVRGAGSFLQNRVTPNDGSNTTPQRLPLVPTSARPLPGTTQSG